MTNVENHVGQVREGTANPAEEIIDKAIPRGPLDGLSQKLSSFSEPTAAGNISDILHQKLNPTPDNRNARRHPGQMQSIDDLRKTIAAESILSPSVTLPSIQDRAAQESPSPEQPLSLEEMTDEQKWGLIEEAMRNANITARDITREDQDAMVHRAHPLDGTVQPPSTTPSESTEPTPQRKGLMGMFDKWRESRAKNHKQKEPKLKISKPRAVGATSVVVATTLATAFSHPGTAEATGLATNQSGNVDNAGVTISFTPEQMLQMRYGSIQPTTSIDLRGTVLENSNIGATNIIGNTVGIDSVAGSPPNTQETAPNGKALAVPMETLTPAEQSSFDKTAADQGTKPPDSFPNEGTQLSGIFRDYFNTHGGIAQQGYPITNVIWEERDDPNHPGQKMKLKVQYFERAIFEYHPENEAPNNVLLTLLGSQAFDADRFANTAPSPNPDQLSGFNQEQGSHTFPETGKTVSGRFLDYWNKNGGLAQQGLPRSNMIVERSAVDGNLYVMQYFERAVFEYHPEVNSEEYKVLLSLLGSGKFNERYVNGASGGPIEDTPTPVPTAVAVATATPRPEATATPDNSLPIIVENPLSSETNFLGGFGFKLDNLGSEENVPDPTQLARVILTTFDRPHNREANARNSEDYKSYISQYLNPQQGRITTNLFTGTGEYYVHDRARTSFIKKIENVSIDLTQRIDFISDLDQTNPDPRNILLDGVAIRLDVSPTGKMTFHLDKKDPWNQGNLSFTLARFFSMIGEIDEANLPEGPNIPPAIPHAGYMAHEMLIGTSVVIPSDILPIFSDP